MSMQPNAGQIAELLSAALAGHRGLPRVVPQPQELPVFSPDWVAAQRHLGWWGEGLMTHSSGGLLVSLADVRVEGEQALLGWFATHPEHRRQGSASDCLLRAMDYARGQGALRMMTAHFIDSRVTSACAFLEHHGFTVRDPAHQNIVMQIDMERYEERPVELPDGYRIASLRMDRLEDWIIVKDGVFESTTTPQWFMTSFGNRWDFDSVGWNVLYYGDEPVGIAGADFHRDRAHPDPISGCQIEYVGVLAAHRGRRLGEMLMRNCLNYTKRRNVQPCQLITQPFRQAAVALYEKLGFRLARENRVYERPL